MRIGDKRIPLNTLQTFTVVGRHLSMSVAAEELAVTQSAVSHQIRQLEQNLNIQLFDRSKRQLRLSTAGARLLKVVSRALDDIKLEAMTLDTDAFVGKLTIAAPPSLSNLWLLPRLPELIERFPDVEIHLLGMPVELPSVLPEADLVVQFGKKHWPRKRVLPLAETDYLPLCAPQLVKDIGRLRPESLKQQTLIHDDKGEAWAGWLAAVGLDNLQPKRHIYVSRSIDALELARIGAGFAINDHITTSTLLAEGELILPFAETLKNYESYYLITEPEENMSNLVREVEAWLRLNIET